MSNQVKIVDNPVNRAITLLMGSTDGRDFLRYIIDDTKLMKKCPSNLSQIEIGFFEGARSVGVVISELVAANSKHNLSELFKGN